MANYPLSRASVPVVKVISMLINGSATSASSGDLLGLTIVGMITPASIASTSATFTVSDDGTTYRPLLNSSKTAYSITIDGTTAQFYFDPTIFYGVRYIKIVAGSTETSKTFKLLARPIL